MTYNPSAGGDATSIQGVPVASLAGQGGKALVLSGDGSQIEGGDVAAPTVLQHTVVLTDAQIKGLPNSAFEILPAPGSNKMLLLSRAVAVPNVIVEYAGIDADHLFGIDNGEINFCVYSTGFQSLLSLPSKALVFTPPLGGASVIDNLVGWFPASYVNLPMRFFVSQNETGADLTGGDPANTMKVIVYYSIVDLT